MNQMCVCVFGGRLSYSKTMYKMNERKGRTKGKPGRLACIPGTVLSCSQFSGRLPVGKIINI